MTDANHLTDIVEYIRNKEGLQEGIMLNLINEVTKIYNNRDNDNRTTTKEYFIDRSISFKINDKEYKIDIFKIRIVSIEVERHISRVTRYISWMLNDYEREDTIGEFYTKIFSLFRKAKDINVRLYLDHEFNDENTKFEFNYKDWSDVIVNITLSEINNCAICSAIKAKELEYDEEDDHHNSQWDFHELSNYSVLNYLFHISEYLD